MTRKAGPSRALTVQTPSPSYLLVPASYPKDQIAPVLGRGDSSELLLDQGKSIARLKLRAAGHGAGLRRARAAGEGYDGGDDEQEKGNPMSHRRIIAKDRTGLSAQDGRAPSRMLKSPFDDSPVPLSLDGLRRGPGQEGGKD